MKPTDLIYDGNRLPGYFARTGARVELNDETLRDGLQNPTFTDPPVERKLEMLHLMVDMETRSADIGLPGAGPRARQAVLARAREIVENGLPIRANCSAVIAVAKESDWTFVEATILAECRRVLEADRTGEAAPEPEPPPTEGPLEEHPW